LKRNTLIIFATVVLVVSLVMAATLGLFNGTKKDNYNVVEIYILNWDTNATGPSDNIDVQFRISIDSNDDGNYEVVRESNIFRDTSVEIVPFNLGDIIQTTQSKFQFKVEVLRVVNDSFVPMHYQKNGPTPVNSGINDVDSSDVWSFDATSIVGRDDLACRISYVYYVNHSS
jgi:hypothetical protein